MTGVALNLATDGVGWLLGLDLAQQQEAAGWWRWVTWGADWCTVEVAGVRCCSEYGMSRDRGENERDSETLYIWRLCDLIPTIPLPKESPACTDSAITPQCEPLNPIYCSCECVYACT